MAMRPGDPYQAVGDSLQADVMRFMAIIAFCLIAILALVRSVEPEPVAQQDPAPVDKATNAPLTEPVPEPDQAPAALAAPPGPVNRRPLPTAQPRVVVAAPAAPDSIDPAPDPARPAEVVRVAPRQPEPVAPLLSAPAPRPESEPGATKASREGLSLRFASDQDFLRLVNRGAIRVFAFNEQGVLSLESDFTFQPAAAPGRVHELLPETIPALMSGALTRSQGAAAYRWGIAMPERMARQIRAFVDGGASGELVIDRFGEVRHHGA